MFYKDIYDDDDGGYGDVDVDDNDHDGYWVYDDDYYQYDVPLLL